MGVFFSSKLDANRWLDSDLGGRAAWMPTCVGSLLKIPWIWSQMRGGGVAPVCGQHIRDSVDQGGSFAEGPFSSVHRPWIHWS